MYIKTQILLLFCLMTLLIPQLSIARCTTGADLSTPSNRFITDNTVGTAIDIKTGLMWKRCSEGQTWNSTTGLCDPAGTIAFIWQEALAQAQSVSFAGKTDWRVPNIKELSSIIERQCLSPAINEVIFPGTEPADFWTSSPSIWPQKSTRVWSVDFNLGINNFDTVSDSPFKPVRLVRNNL